MVIDLLCFVVEADHIHFMGDAAHLEGEPAPHMLALQLVAGGSPGGGPAGVGQLHLHGRVGHLGERRQFGPRRAGHSRTSRITSSHEAASRCSRVRWRMLLSCWAANSWANCRPVLPTAGFGHKNALSRDQDRPLVQVAQAGGEPIRLGAKGEPAIQTQSALRGRRVPAPLMPRRPPAKGETGAVIATCDSRRPSNSLGFAARLEAPLDLHIHPSPGTQTRSAHATGSHSAGRLFCVVEDGDHFRGGIDFHAVATCTSWPADHSRRSRSVDPRRSEDCSAPYQPSSRTNRRAWDRRVPRRPPVQGCFAGSVGQCSSIW